MPRRADDTRERLLRAGQQRFARDGVHQAPLRAIVADAGQRNASALHYHFRSRQGLLDAIIAAHDVTIEAERREFLDRLERPRELDDLRLLVSALVVPFGRKLLDADGREFLLIIAQLSHLFDAWDEPGAPAEARRVFLAIQQRLGHLPDSVSHLRVTTFLDLVTHALAARARQLATEVQLPLGHEEFLANLIDMSVGALAAPSNVAAARTDQVAQVSPGNNGS